MLNLTLDLMTLDIQDEKARFGYIGAWLLENYGQTICQTELISGPNYRLNECNKWWRWWFSGSYEKRASACCPASNHFLIMRLI